MVRDSSVCSPRGTRDRTNRRYRCQPRKTLYSVLGPDAFAPRQGDLRPYAEVVKNRNDRLHTFWLSELEEAAAGVAAEGEEWSAALVQRAKGYARLGPAPTEGEEYQRLEKIRAGLRLQRRGGDPQLAESLSHALLLLEDKSAPATG